MIGQCKEPGFKEPVWKQKDSTVNVVFPVVKVLFIYSEGITKGLKVIYLDVIDVIIKKGKSNPQKRSWSYDSASFKLFTDNNEIKYSNIFSTGDLVLIGIKQRKIWQSRIK